MSSRLGESPLLPSCLHSQSPEGRLVAFPGLLQVPVVSGCRCVSLLWGAEWMVLVLLPDPTLEFCLDLLWDVLNTGAGMSQCALPYSGSSEPDIEDLRT